MPERHLGLHMPGEASLPQDHIARIAEHLEAHLDADVLLAIARPALQPPSLKGLHAPAGRQAFCWQSVVLMLAIAQPQGALSTCWQASSCLTPCAGSAARPPQIACGAGVMTHAAGWKPLC